eukprot:symbB.v1.2.027490.t1/scaffold2823.1/size69429/2
MARGLREASGSCDFQEKYQRWRWRVLRRVLTCSFGPSLMQDLAHVTWGLEWKGWNSRGRTQFAPKRLWGQETQEEGHGVQICNRKGTSGNPGKTCARMTRTAATPHVPGPGQIGRSAWSQKALHVWPQSDGEKDNVETVPNDKPSVIDFEATSPAAKSISTVAGPTRCSSVALTEPEVVESFGGGLLVPYEDDEVCLFLLGPEASDGPSRARDHFVTLRVGPVGSDGLVIREECIKVAGSCSSNRLEWVVRGVPLKHMAQKSPLGFPSLLGWGMLGSIQKEFH